MINATNKSRVLWDHEEGNPTWSEMLKKASPRIRHLNWDIIGKKRGRSKACNLKGKNEKDTKNLKKRSWA